MRLTAKFSVAVLAVVLLPTPAIAARVGDVVETDIWRQAIRFFSLSDPALRLSLIGAILLGLNCGMLGSFVVVRRMALVGDTLSHAVLPGVALGFLYSMTKDPLVILVGATVVGGLAMLVVSWIMNTTRLKQDAALGLVLSSFYAVGICLFTIIQRLPTGAKSGLDKFMFGQASALNGADAMLIAITTAVSLAFVALFYPGLQVLSFHRGFGETLGLPMRFLHHALMLLTSFAIVVAMQAVGVVLVSAMLIIPPATAYLLTDRLHRMMILAAVIGVATASLGAFLSFLGSNLPTGPLMVLAGTMFFSIAFFFAPRHGWLVRMWRLRRKRQRTERENTLKAMHRVLENRGFKDEAVSLLELANVLREPLDEARARVQRIAHAGLATINDGGDAVHFTPAGEQLARSIVRNHRLWELYLTNIAHFEPDHVHDDAEKIEHMLSEEEVRNLERRLAFPEIDPHGRKIPSIADVYGSASEAAAAAGGKKDSSGYGG